MDQRMILENPGGPGDGGGRCVCLVLVEQVHGRQGGQGGL
jgi:hypothetical protein